MKWKTHRGSQFNRFKFLGFATITTFPNVCNVMCMWSWSPLTYVQDIRRHTKFISSHLKNDYCDYVRWEEELRTFWVSVFSIFSVHMRMFVVLAQVFVRNKRKSREALLSVKSLVPFHISDDHLTIRIFNSSIHPQHNNPKMLNIKEKYEKTETALTRSLISLELVFLQLFFLSSSLEKYLSEKIRMRIYQSKL